MVNTHLVLSLDIDALRRAKEIDPEAFVWSLLQAALRKHGDRTFYASGMVAGEVMWQGTPENLRNVRVVNIKNINVGQGD